MSNETIMTGFSGLDKVLGGLRPRTLNVISGRPNIGKTSLALNIAMNVAKTSGKAVVYYSIESARSEIVHRLLMPKLVYKGESGTAEPVKTILNGVADLPIYVDDCSNLTSELLMERFDALLADMINVGLVIIDYFDLISFDGESYCSRHLESMEISKALKLFACKYEVPVVVLKQCSKKAEYRKDHIPALEDIRCWGSLDQVADSVILLKSATGLRN